MGASVHAVIRIRVSEDEFAWNNHVESGLLPVDDEREFIPGDVLIFQSPDGAQCIRRVETIVLRDDDGYQGYAAQLETLPLDIEKIYRGAVSKAGG